MNRKERRYKDKLRRKEQEKFQRSQDKIGKKPHITLTREQVNRMLRQMGKSLLTYELLK